MVYKFWKWGNNGENVLFNKNIHPLLYIQNHQQWWWGQAEEDVFHQTQKREYPKLLLSPDVIQRRSLRRWERCPTWYFTGWKTTLQNKLNSSEEVSLWLLWCDRPNDQVTPVSRDRLKKLLAEDQLKIYMRRMIPEC